MERRGRRTFPLKIDYVEMEGGVEELSEERKNE